MPARAALGARELTHPPLSCGFLPRRPLGPMITSVVFTDLRWSPKPGARGTAPRPSHSQPFSSDSVPRGVPPGVRFDLAQRGHKEHRAELTEIGRKMPVLKFYLT